MKNPLTSPEVLHGIKWDVAIDWHPEQFICRKTGLSIAKDPLYSEPFTTKSVTLYFRNEVNHIFSCRYSYGLSVIDLIQAINFFYLQPVTDDSLGFMKRRPEYEPPAVLDKLAHNIKPTLRDYHGNQQIVCPHFVPHQNGYLFECSYT